MRYQNEDWLTQIKTQDLAFSDLINQMGNDRYTGFFHTPQLLCETIFKLSKRQNFQTVLKPCMGIGSLLHMNRNFDTNGVEVNPTYVQIAKYYYPGTEISILIF